MSDLDPSRRAVLLGAAGLAATTFGAPGPAAARSPQPGAFAYTELQVSVPFAEVPWTRINAAIKPLKGFLNKTWLTGLGTGSAGGIYAFATVEDAVAFVTDYFPNEARGFGVAQTTRVFDAAGTAAASQDLASAHFGTAPARPVGAFLYTELRASYPDFAAVRWQERNARLRAVPGLLGKTWLHGHRTGSLGGFYAFESVETPNRFAQDALPQTTKALGVAYTARVFEAAPVEAASRDMRSPFFS